MKDTVEINKPEETMKKPEKKERKRSTAGIFIGFCLVLVGLMWYAVNLGIIPVEYIKQQAGPILVVLLGIIILIRSI